MAEFIGSIKDPNGNLDLERLESNIGRVSTELATQTEVIQDAAAQAMVNSNSITITYDDEGNAISTDVKVDDATLEVDASNGVQVKDGGITAAKLADPVALLADIAAQDVGATPDQTSINAAINAVGTKLNDLIAALKTGNVMADS
jgi:hypothetical protein